MKVFYKGKYLSEIESKDNFKAFIEEYQRKALVSDENIRNRAINLEEKISSLRGKKNTETSSEYKTYIENENPLIIKELKAIGMEFYKDDLLDIYFLDKEETMHGFTILKNGNKSNVPLSLIPLKTTLNFPREKDFELK